MISFPNAKINIGLNIVEKRVDGFHNLESIFVPSQLNDILEITEIQGSETIFKNTGLLIDGSPENNLCMKAYNLIKEDFPIPAVRIHLHKLIPFGGGLGGGSADASFTLKLLNDLFQLKISEEKLLKYAEKLGSDCSFFIYNTPCYATKKGEVLEQIKLELNGLYLAIINPGFPIGTKEAYAGIVPKKREESLKEIIQLPIEEWKNHIQNDFEKNAFKLYPEIEIIKHSLYKKGALYASMSGSGSSLFALFNEKPNLFEYSNYFVHIEHIAN